MPSSVLNLICRKCSAAVLRYKKSGSGKLIRIYLDRVVEPVELGRLKSAGSKSDLPPLHCNGCGTSLGMPMIESGRLAYRVLPGALGKQKDHS